jgi:hypothetical protein
MGAFLTILAVNAPGWLLPAAIPNQVRVSLALKMHPGMSWIARSKELVSSIAGKLAQRLPANEVRDFHLQEERT